MRLAQRLLYRRYAALLAMMVVIFVLNITLVLNSVFQNAIAANGYRGHGTKELCKLGVCWWWVGDQRPRERVRR